MAKKPSTAKATKAAAAKRASQKLEIPEVVTRTQLGNFLGLTPRRISMLTKDGVFHAVGRGKLDFAKSVEAYIQFRERGVENRIKVPSSQDLLRERQRQALERKMAREDRDIISLDEAMLAIEEVTGVFLTSLSGMPARITRDRSERQRLEKIFDGERKRLAKDFAEKQNSVRAGQHTVDAETEDDA